MLSNRRIEQQRTNSTQIEKRLNITIYLYIRIWKKTQLDPDKDRKR